MPNNSNLLLLPFFILKNLINNLKSNNNNYVSNYINLGPISKIMLKDPNTYFSKYLSEIFREKVLFILLLGCRNETFEQALRNQELNVSLFLMNSTDVKSFAKLELNLFNSEDLIKDNNIKINHV